MNTRKYKPDKLNARLGEKQAGNHSGFASQRSPNLDA
jgi:hypothetical protein